MGRCSFRIWTAASVIVTVSGCGQLLGLGDFTEGTGGSTSTTSAIGTGGAGGVGGTTATTTSSTTTTSTSSAAGGGGHGGTGGSTGTGGTGGTGGAPCVPSGVEVCQKPGDEDCDGVGCSDVVWSESFPSAAEQSSTSIAVDAQRNVIVAGFFAGTMKFGNKTLISSGMNDYYLAKLDSTGLPLWAKQFGNAVDNGTQAVVAVDKSTGDVYLAGDLLGSADFGGGSLTSTGQRDVFLASFDASGAPRWSKRFGDASPQLLRSLAVDTLGNAFVAGENYGTIDFGGGPLTAPGGNGDVFIAKFSSIGTHLATKRLGDLAGQPASAQAVIEIVLDPANNVLTSGTFTTSIDLGGSSLLGPFSGFVAKFDSLLNHSWSKKVRLGQIASDSMGNLIGYGLLVPGVNDFDGHALMGNAHSGFVVKFSTLGAFQWGNTFDCTQAVSATNVATDANDNIVVTGSSFGDIDFGNGALANVGQNSNFFLAKLPADGSPALWSKMFGGAGQHDPSAVATDPVSNAVLLTGMITQTVDFGTGLLTSDGSYDVVVAKFQP